MTNDVTMIDDFVVPDWLKNQAPVENDFGKVGGFPTIAPFSTSTFKIRVEDQDKVVNAPLPVVILAITPKGNAYNRAYYKDPYVDGTVAAPDCSSSDGVAPDDGDSRQSETCAACPMSAFGTSSTGKGQACAQGKTLYVVPANKLDSIVYQIRVAPTSLKNVAAYGAKLTRSGLRPSTVVTNMGLVPEIESQKSYPILRPELGGFLEEADGLASIKRSESPEITSMVIDVPSLPAPTTPQQQAAPQKEPEPAPQEESAPLETGFETAAPQQQEAPQQRATPRIELDSAGQPWDAKLHSSGKTKLQDGTWRKKAVKKASQKPPTETQEPDQKEDKDPLSDVLAGWG